MISFNLFIKLHESGVFNLNECKWIGLFISSLLSHTKKYHDPEVAFIIYAVNFFITPDTSVARFTHHVHDELADANVLLTCMN